MQHTHTHTDKPKVLAITSFIQHRTSLYLIEVSFGKEVDSILSLMSSADVPEINVRMDQNRTKRIFLISLSWNWTLHQAGSCHHGSCEIPSQRLRSATVFLQRMPPAGNSSRPWSEMDGFGDLGSVTLRESRTARHWDTNLATQSIIILPQQVHFRFALSICKPLGQQRIVFQCSSWWDF